MRKSAIAGALAALLILCTPTAYSDDALRPHSARRIHLSDLVGFNLPLLTLINQQTHQVDAEHYDIYIRKLKALGLRRIRLDFHWSMLEPTQGTLSPLAMAFTDDLVNRLKKDDLSVIVHFDGVPPYFAAQGCAVDLFHDNCPPSEAGTKAMAARLLELAQRYPSIEHWQIGNEPNLSLFGLVAFDDAYARMAETVAEAFARKGLRSKLALAGFGYYGDYQPSPGPQFQMKTGSMIYELATRHGPLVSWLASVAYHPYTDTPEGEPPEGNRRTSGDFVARVRNLNQKLRATGNVKEIWATEFGWSTYPGTTGVNVQPLISEKEQADYLLRRLSLIFSLAFDRIYFFDLSDMGTGPVKLPYQSPSGAERDDFYGVLRNDGAEKPAYRALARFFQITGNDLTESASFPIGQQETSSWYGPVFIRPDGKHLWMARSAIAKTVSISQLQSATIHHCCDGTSEAARSVDHSVQIPLSSELSVIEF